jgi:hypothetical protein
MTIEYYTPADWRKKLYELSGKPSRNFSVVFVAPYEFKDGRVTKYMVGYWFIPR